MKKNLLPLSLLAGLLLWQCSGTETDTSVRKSLDEGINRISKAVNIISRTKGYELMTLTDMTKSGDGYSDSISLGMISGVFDFMPDTFVYRHFSMPFWKFSRTADSDKLVMNMPYKLVSRPRYLFNPDPEEGETENDFTITSSDYHYYYSFLRRFDYLLNAGLALEGEDIGKLEVASAGESFSGRSYSSKYSFTDDYSFEVAFTRGDTSVSSMALLEGDELLMGEENHFIHSGFRTFERKYILTIGDVQIVRSTGVDSIEVYLAGVLQNSAAAVITDEDETEGSVCRHRDIELTFNDGTTARLSELMGPSLEILKSLAGPMREMYFARRIVDHLAMTIYYQKR
ncbi:MAG: hypothetical protein MUE37_14845 [Bacteroidales bacterium]|nr:hypothetical protein [Bacteroidales bacterium]